MFFFSFSPKFLFRFVLRVSSFFFWLNSSTHSPTTSSLALRTFRTKFPYTKDNGIPIIVGEPFDFIKQSFTGGHVDVYTPHGFNLYHYDVNSLYPSVMKKYKMALGDAIYFESSFESNNLTNKLQENRPYGFFEVEITTPTDLKYPIIQTRVKTKDGYRTIAPLGTWRDVLSTIEIYNAMDNFGYKFKVLRGYVFDETDIIYDKYVDYFNNIKCNTPKSDPMYLTAKLLMNGLFGKTGQDYKFNDNIIVNNDDLLKLIQDKNIEVISFTELSNDSNLVTFFNKGKYSNNLNLLNSYNGCIAHASAITAGARTEMSLVIKYLMENNYIIYYMDTDSLIVNKPLPEHFVSNFELGLFKLENIYKEAVFLAPKVYAGITADGNEIIKIKGLSHKTIQKDVTFDLLKSLLHKEKSLNFNQTKSFRKLEEATITLINQTYNLIPTENKRQLVYDNNNLLINTKPFFINQDKKLNNID